ncbi:hypothetical protein OAL13_00165 [bacterium]|nr:hypothetical protein [bacterium]
MPTITKTDIFPIKPLFEPKSQPIGQCTVDWLDDETVNVTYENFGSGQTHIDHYTKEQMAEQHQIAKDWYKGDFLHSFGITIREGF